MIDRSKIATVVAELLGSAVLTYAVLAISRSGLGISYFIATAVGVSFALMVLLLSNVVRGYFNPVLTLGLWSLRKIPTVEAAIYMAAQFLGAVGASALFVYLSNQKLQTIAEKSFNWRVLVAEGVGTFVLGFGVAAVIYRRYEGLQAAAALGSTLFLAMLVAAAGANGLVNPATALGLQSWSKSYILGPIAGAVIGMNLYSLLFAPLLSGSGEAVAAAPAAKKPAARKRATTRRKK